MMSDKNPFDYFDKIFCINLDSRPDRWELARDEFRKVGILDRVERVTALTTEEMPYDPRPRKNRNASDLLGQFACASSHNKCTKLAIQYNAKNYLVFEDDFYFKNFDKDYLNTCISELPSDWRLFSFGYNDWSQHSIASYSKNLNKMYGFGLAHAYAINGNMFEHLNNEFEKRVIRSETRRKRWWKRNEYFLGNATKYQYGVKKMFAFQRDGFSDVASVNKEHGTINNSIMKKHFIITSGDENAGFTAYIKFALNGILHAEQHDLIPVVNFDNSIRNFFYEESYGKNTWEYYFEPVAKISYADVIGNNLPKCTLKDRQFRNQNSHPNPERVDTFWKSDRRIGGDEHKGDPKTWLESKRKTARQLMKKYVRVKPHIQKIVDNFVNENFNNKNIIGCHVRGTDFAYATATSVEKYFEILDTQKEVHIFLATDQTQYVELFKNRYGNEKVLTYDSLRSDNDVAAFELENGSPYKKGEDVLIDTLLLSRTNSIIKCAAAGGEFALWFNENLKVLHDFALESKFQKGGHWDRQNTAFQRLKIK